MSVLEEVKRMLDNPTNLDEKLNTIIALVTNRLLVRISNESLPSELEYIAIEVSIARFNRIGSEGISGHSVDGESMTFNGDDFSAYEEDIEAWKNKQKDIVEGRVRFL